MSIGVVLLIILILILCGGFGTQRSAFIWPGGAVGTLLIIILILMALGYLR